MNRNFTRFTSPARRIAGLFAGLLLPLCGGCASDTQLSFATPEEAVAALTYAASTGDRDYARSLFGPETDEFSSGDPDVDAFERAQFSAAILRKHELQRNEDGSIDVLVGEHAAPFPVPLIEHESRWMFDTPAGVERLADVRVGYNELRTLRGLRAVAAAQQEYHSLDRDGDGVLEYAQRIISTPGTHNGLYWPTGPTEPNSPLGEYYTDAEAPRSESLGYHGYFYSLLTHEGGPGATTPYLDAAGNLTHGFAVLAYPAVYGETAIMTFIMSADGTVYEKDLGPEATPTAVRTITSFNPADGWAITNDS